MTAKKSKRGQQHAATQKAIAEINAERVARGVCRHCGGPVPCWSPYGDVRVGVRHAEATP